MFSEYHPPELHRFNALNEMGHTLLKQIELSGQPQDGVLTARVVGEFSAGKTRFLSELFGDLIPQALLPVSSLEPQTKLQLEITFGESPRLSLIEKSADYKTPELLEYLSEFPDRNHSGISGADPFEHRLRLEINEPRLILQNGDGFSDDKQAKKLFIIDTPGWNSGDDEISEREASSILTGYHNLALVYVSHAARVDGDLNARRLRDFLEALSDSEFLDTAKLICIITHCPKKDEARLSPRFRQMVNTLWEELGNDPDELELHVSCVEFSSMSSGEREAFRNHFWQNLLPSDSKQSTQANDPWSRSIRQWPESWDLRPLLMQTFECLTQTKDKLLRAKKNGQFVAGMNMYRLMGLDAKSIQNKVKATWFKQLGCESLTAVMKLPVLSLPVGHPMSIWLEHYWQFNTQNVLAPVHDFFQQALDTIHLLNPNTPDLDAHFATHLEAHYATAMQAMEHSFATLVLAAVELKNEIHPEKVVATLLTLSLLQARYEDYYDMHMQDVQNA